jgi:hypothetical protein
VAQLKTEASITGLVINGSKTKYVKIKGSIQNLQQDLVTDEHLFEGLRILNA